MIVIITFVSPVLFLYFKYHKLELQNLPVYILAVYLVTFFIKYLDKEGFFKTYSVFFFQQKLCQEFLFRALILEDFLLQNPLLIFFGGSILSMVIFFYIVFDPTPSYLFYWFSVFLYLLSTIYARLRYSIINEYSCNLYKEKNTFSWPDVLKGINSFLVISVPNKLTNTSYEFSHIYPKKRSMHTWNLLRAFDNNPEMTRAAVAGALAVGTGVAAVATPVLKETQKALSTPEMRALIEGKEELVKLQDRFKLAQEHVESYPPMDKITDEKVLGRFRDAADIASDFQKQTWNQQCVKIPALQENFIKSNNSQRYTYMEQFFSGIDPN